jgi:dienelactone hydrolase
MAGGLQNGPETPKTFVMDDKTPGTGKYPAQRLQDGPTARYTVYAPKTPPPADVKMPVVVYATCGGPGTQYTNLLTEIASHGYLVIAAGPPAPGTVPAPASGEAAPAKGFGGMMPSFGDNVLPMKKAVDWVVEGKAAKYGNIDTTKIATSGLSCGGLQVTRPTNLSKRIH